MKKSIYLGLISVCFLSLAVMANAQTTPTITLFGTKSPNPTNGSVNMSWQASSATDANLTMTCTPGTVSFTTDKGNAPSCDKGGVWTWSGSTGDSITVTPSGNTSPVTVPFTLTLTQNGMSTGQSQTVYVTFPASISQSPIITLFGTKSPNPTTGSVNMSWQASASTDANLTMICTPGSINFTTDKGNYPSCSKGGVWTWSSTSGDSITVTPSGNSSSVTVPFTLTLTKNGMSTGQSQTVYVTFPPTTTQNPTITLFGAKSPNPTNNSVNMSWQALSATDANLTMVCNPGSISFTTDKGNYPSCDKGGVWTWSATGGDSITLYPSGNSSYVTIPFTLTLTKNGMSTGQSQTISVTFPPTVTPNQSITLFGAKDPNPTNGSVNMSWQASGATDAMLDMDCTVGSISFTTDKGNYPSCAKGGVWSWSGQTGDSITLYPSGNSSSVTVPFTLTLSKNGVPTGQSKTISVTFPPTTTQNPTITLFGAKSPNPTDHSVNMSWQASGSTDAQLDVVCTPGSISFTTDKGNAPSCDKGGIWLWSNQSSGGITVYPSGNTQAQTVNFILTLTKNGASTGQTQTISVTFPASYQSTHPTITLFGAKDPNPTNHSVNMSWQASSATGATLDMECTPGSISFTTNKGNYPSCNKGGVWSWSSVTGDSITLIPSGNMKSVTIPFTLTLTQNGAVTDQSKTIYVTFPPTSVTNPTPASPTTSASPVVSPAPQKTSNPSPVNNPTVVPQATQTPYSQSDNTNVAPVNVNVNPDNGTTGANGFFQAISNFFKNIFRF
ncbi:MAG: hypothetical protein KGJ35_00695 [Patescibacteria group bacterium]|nr:hypothetical protein [Patescibacteria group bacterium]